MNELKIFNSPEFGQVRTITLDDEPWFVGKDVADALGYSNSRDALARHVDDEDKTSVVIPDTTRYSPGRFPYGCRIGQRDAPKRETDGRTQTLK